MTFQTLKHIFGDKTLFSLIDTIKKTIKDPRTQCARIKYKIEHLIFAYIIAKICGCFSYREVEDFVMLHRPFFLKYIKMEKFNPSDDTFQVLLAEINNNEFMECYKLFTGIADEYLEQRRHFAIDGKTMRGTQCKNHKSKHIMTAYDVHSGLIAAQRNVDDHENEIVGFPDILNQLSSIGFKNLLISSDAIAAQTDIIEQIEKKGWDYCFGLKRNQPKLYEAAKSMYKIVKEDYFSEMHTEEHGRDVYHKYYFIDNPFQFCQKHSIKIDEKWSNLNGLAIVVSKYKKNKVTKQEIRFYITSLKFKVQCVNSIHNHWHIENNLHWQLDTSYREDNFRERSGFSAENNSICFKFGLLICSLGKIFFNRPNMSFNRIITRIKIKPDYIEDFIGPLIQSHI